ncbi:MAG: histone [archaeon]
MAGGSSDSREKGLLPRAGVVRLMRKAGRARFERESVEELHNFLEQTAKRLAAKSGVLAGIGKRKTITKEDVNFAATE